jgi:hypothetical protein
MPNIAISDAERKVLRDFDAALQAAHAMGREAFEREAAARARLCRYRRVKIRSISICISRRPGEPGSEPLLTLTLPVRSYRRPLPLRPPMAYRAPRRRRLSRRNRAQAEGLDPRGGPNRSGPRVEERRAAGPIGDDQQIRLGDQTNRGGAMMTGADALIVLPTGGRCDLVVLDIAPIDGMLYPVPPRWRQ